LKPIRGSEVPHKWGLSACGIQEKGASVKRYDHLQTLSRLSVFQKSRDIFQKPPSIFQNPATFSKNLPPFSKTPRHFLKTPRHFAKSPDIFQKPCHLLQNLLTFLIKATTF
jgi:hypothetical protein